MSDAAAVSLGEWFLAGVQPRPIETLANVLRGEPPLALWLALKADRLSSAPPRNLADLAALLAEHGLRWLQWEAGSALLEIDPVWGDVLATRIAVAVLVSEQAAELAAENGQATSRQARLLGLLRDPAEWLDVLKQAGSAHSRIRLPKWLAGGQFDPAAVEAVEQAASRIAAAPVSSNGSQDPPAIAGEVAVSPAYLDRVREAAARWGASHLAARWLSALMAKLAKLAVLERSLGEAVEAGKMAAMAEFAAGAGHEINNPLAVIAGRAQLLLRDESAPERRRDLALMNTQAMRVHEMIADLRLFAAPPELQRQSVDLTLLVSRLVEEMRPTAKEQDTVVSWVEASASVSIEADPVQLTVAVRALCQNALDALGQRGRIEIVVASDGEEASITVADDGPGISPEQRPHIFEPFYSARQAGRGVGMGLSKCWRIVTCHGGRIEVGSPGGAGAVFMIRLPLKRRDAGD